MKHLTSLHNYFVRYWLRLAAGVLFVTISNVFATQSPAVVRNVLDEVVQDINSYHLTAGSGLAGDMKSYIFTRVLWGGVLLLGLAIMRGLFMFLMRQTIIVMSRHIEFDQKNEIYNHYQKLHTHFFKTHFTGDMMNRISEDVARVRQYTGPSIMYAVNLITLLLLCTYGMLRVSPLLTLYAFLPFPLLAITIYLVNRIIYHKSGEIQAQLSDLTTTAQESYSGVRVVKSFVQEAAMIRFFNATSEKYRKSSINLSMTESFYFPSMSLFIGLSMLATIFVGGMLVMRGEITVGNIAEFIFYINLLMFPVSSIGNVASTAQRAGASQKRIDEFLNTEPEIVSPDGAVAGKVDGSFMLTDVSFTYPHPGIQALKHFTLDAKRGEKIAIIGRTGSGKSTIAHLLLRMYNVQEGAVAVSGMNVRQWELHALRDGIAYAPQDAFLFSDTVYNNIRFGRQQTSKEEIERAAHLADLDKDIHTLAQGYDTIIGEAGCDAERWAEAAAGAGACAVEELRPIAAG